MYFLAGLAHIRESMPFTDFSLHPQLQRAIQRAGFTTPTPIQEQAIPVALDGRDLIGTAQTGTGKTAAFVLPIVQRLLDHPQQLGRTRALIVTPTRELAEQINTTVRQFTRSTSIRSAVVYGGVGMAPQEHALRNGFEIIVACPGRLLDHIDRGTAKLDGIEVLVLDEADRMLDMGFLPSVKRLLSYLPRERQTMLFSATFAPELQQLARQTLRKPARVDVGLGAPTRTVAHALYPVAQHLKTPLLLHLLGGTDTNSVLIFTRTKHRANRVAQQVQRAGYNTAVLHSNKSQNQRQLALDNFRAGKVQILVATDIAARGLDVATISHVINYDIPDTADAYIHRIGRTGRAQREGDALTLVTSEDAATCREIERALKAPIERRTLPDFDYSMPAPAHNEFQRDPRPARPQPRRNDHGAHASAAAAPQRQQRRETHAPRHEAQVQTRQPRRAPAHRPANTRQNS
jgi:ATP-dependent RNA helicase RhlE